MPPRPLRIPSVTSAPSDKANGALLSPAEYDQGSATYRSDQDSDSDDDQLVKRARNSAELRAADRLLFMEDEETDRLVTDARRRQERDPRARPLQRRSSSLMNTSALAKPLSLLGQRSSESQSRSRSPTAGSTGPGGWDSVEEGLLEDDIDEKTDRHRLRRERRKHKKDRLLSEARHGEDGELMHEMEAGGIKEGSDTGDSSDRDDSGELDRQGLQHLAEKASKRRRNCCRWFLIYSLIALAFAILLLVAWKLSIQRRAVKPGQTFLSNGTALFAPTTIIISLDGFRADFLNRGLTPRLNSLVKEGVSPLYMNPSFPSVTFPNHYTLVTGLYPEAHGIVGNTFWDPDLESQFYNTDPSRSLDPKWWGGEPLWVTAENQGIRTAVHMWPGSEAHILGVDPTYLDEYNGKEKLPRKVDRILEFLDMPGKETEDEGGFDKRPQLIAAYVPNVDADGHTYRPNSTEVQATIKSADDMIDQLFHGLEQRNLTDIVNVIVVSDHGMATTDISRLIQVEDVVDMSKIEHVDGWPLLGLRPKDPADLTSLHEQIKTNLKDDPNYEIYLRDVDMPERYHFAGNPRIAPLWIIPKVGYGAVQKSEFDIKAAEVSGENYRPRGLHGYDHEHPLMRAIFIARGPAFPHPPNSRLDPFQNIEVYHILCDSLGLTPKANNGTMRLPLKPVGLHSDTGSDAAEDTADPPTHTLSATTASSTAAASTTSSSALSSSFPTKTVAVDKPEEPKSSQASQQTLPQTSSVTTTKTTSAPATTTSTGGSGGDVDKGDEDDKDDEKENDEDDDEDDKSASDKVHEAVESFWDWFSDKWDTFWDKVKGEKDDQDKDDD